MITNTGKNIIAKYLLGNAPAYASYIALGCGAKPRDNINSISGASSSGSTITVSNTTSVWVGAKISIVSGTGVLSTLEDTLVTAIGGSTTFTVSPAPTTPLSSATIFIQTDPAKEVLDFEMFRVPITSKGYVNDNGVNKIVLSAQLPTEERYEISEVGVFSAGSNTTAGSYDSKTISAFADTENWQYNDGSALTAPTSITSSLIDTSNIITSTANAIQTNSNNIAFLNAARASRYERCRYLNNILMLRGNTSTLTVSGGQFNLGTTPKFLQISGQTVDLSKNSTSDLLKVAFSLINVLGNDSTVPDTVRVLVEFASDDGTQYARLEAEVLDSEQDFATNRYCVVTKRLDELVYSSGSTSFSWNSVNVIKVYVSTLISGTASEDFFVALDAIRLDNVSSQNPLYGMTGYSIIQNDNKETIVKTTNSNNYIEYRFILDVT